MALPVSSNFHTAYQSFRTIHGNAANTIFTKVLLRFQHQRFPVCSFQFQCVINFRKLAFKLHIHYRTNDLFDLTNISHIVCLREE